LSNILQIQENTIFQISRPLKKKFELMLTRRVKAYSSSGSVV